MSNPRNPRKYTLTLDPASRLILIHYEESGVIEQFLTSDNSKVSVGVRTAEDGLPVVVAVVIDDNAKYDLIQDWIEEGIEAGLGDFYGDEHYKANNID